MHDIQMSERTYLLMVGLARYDAVAAVDLLQQDDSHQLMREGHLREAKVIICSSDHFVCQAEGTAYYKLDMAHSAYTEAVNLL